MEKGGHQGKIFGLGLSRTGTSSLTAGLEMLGIKTWHFPMIMENSSFKTRFRYRMNRYARLFCKCWKPYRDICAGTGNTLELRTNKADAFQAWTDIPTLRFYKELDQKYPGSRFILTLRDEAAWLDSCRRFFSEGAHDGWKWTQLHLDIYAANAFDEEKFKAAWQHHLADIRDYFRDRPNDLLEINITEGEGFEKLCPFLGIPIPKEPFPWTNKGKSMPK